MKATEIRVGFIPLVDAAPLIIADEMGFAAEEGIALDLRRAPSWSSLRDMLVFGQVDAAHMLSVMPVAMALGLGGTQIKLSVLSVLSMNGTVIGVSTALADRLSAAGHDFAFDDARTAGRALIDNAPGRLRIGVPFPFSMHAELLYYWLNAMGLPAPQAVDIRTVPPPLMAQAIREGMIDAFCVGEPWGSLAVENGDASLLLPGRAIWSAAPEKVLTVRSDWTDTEPDLSRRLIRAVTKAARWLSDPASLGLTAEILSRGRWLDLPAVLIERGLTGTLTVTPRGQLRTVPGFVEFHRGAAGFPWISQGSWIAHQLAARTGLDRAGAVAAGAAVFRPDLYRGALAGSDANLPGAASKIEGGSPEPIQVGSTSGTLLLSENRFFDGKTFDPDS